MELKSDRQLRHPRYTLASKEVAHMPTFSILEDWVSESSVKRVAQWERVGAPLITKLPDDMLNCDIDVTKTTTVADLERINDKQAEKAARIEYFSAAGADSPELRASVKAMIDNAVSIGTHLHQVSLLLVNMPSRKSQFEAAVATMQSGCAKLGQLGATLPVALKILPGFECIGGTPAFEAQLMAWVPACKSKSKASSAKSLIYSASEHGWAGADFHRKCDNVPRLLVIARSKSGFVFGGFTLVGFGGNDNTARSDEDAFLFTLINPHDIAPTKLLIKKDEPKATIKGLQFGAVFGWNAAADGNDLFFVTNCNFNTNSNSKLGGSYTDTTGKGSLLFTGSEHFGTMAEILAFNV